jgi:phosphoserine phosphatase
VESIDPAGILEPVDKGRLAEPERIARGPSPADCVAYGDSMSDLPPFRTLQNTVAVNADESLERVAVVDEIPEPVFAPAASLLATGWRPGAAKAR